MKCQINLPRSNLRKKKMNESKEFPKENYPAPDGLSKYYQKFKKQFQH